MLAGAQHNALDALLHAVLAGAVLGPRVHDGSGYISSEEFVAPGTGLLDYARKYLLRETPAPAVAVAMIY